MKLLNTDERLRRVERTLYRVEGENFFILALLFAVLGIKCGAF